MQARRFIGTWCVYLFLASGLVLAQVTTGTILGTVSDSTGAVIPGAKITLRNLETGISRSVTTDAAGRYKAPQLGLGRYEVTAEMTGFQTVERTGITLAVGQEAVVDFALQVGAVAERVTVTGEAPLVESTSSSVSSVVEGETIRDMPLNGRSFDQLAMLQPGVVSVSPPMNQPSWWGNARRISVSGARPTQAVTLLDGTNINGMFNSSGSAVNGQLLGVEAVREFRVLTSDPSAEYGRAAGGVINIVTRSGTNDWHGVAFEFLRNSALDAKNFFERHEDPIAPFKRNQFGGGLGGPILKNRAFFYGTYEGLRERLGRVRRSATMNEAAHRGILPGLAAPVAIPPSVQPFVDLFPLPNGADRGAGVGLLTLTATQPSSENFGQMRIDYQLSDKHSLFGRYTDDRAGIVDPFDGNVIRTNEEIPGAVKLGNSNVSLARPLDAFNHYLTLQLTSILSPTALNTLRFGYTRIGWNATLLTKPDILRFDNGYASPGIITLTGITSIGYGRSGGSVSIQNMFQYSDDVTLLRGDHSLKMGFDSQRFRNFWFRDVNTRWAWSFNTLQDFLLGRPTGGLGGALPGSDPSHYMRQWLFGIYFQDDWRVRPRLTLNLGLRWEPGTLASNANKRLPKFGAILDVRRDTNFALVDHPFRNNMSLQTFQPRLGFAWDVNGDGKTAVRGGFAITYEPLLPNHTTLISQSPPFTLAVDTTIASFFPNGLANFTGITPTLGTTQDVDYNACCTPMIMQYNLSVQRELAGNIGVTIGYVGSLGRHLGVHPDFNAATPVLQDGRFFHPVGTPRRNPGLGSIGMITYAANAYYNGLQLSVRKRFSHGFTANANYSFSRTIDDFSSVRAGESGTGNQFNTQASPQIPDCLKCDRGVSDFHRAHAFTGGFTYSLPLGPRRALGGNLTGVAAKLAGGWSVGGIGSLYSAPYNSPRVGFDRPRSLSAINGAIFRPDLTPGGNNNPTQGVTEGCPGVVTGRKLGTPDLWYDPCQFVLQPAGFFGNVGRNTLSLPRLRNMDFSIIKNTEWGEGKNLEFRAEFFNIFNHTTLGLVNLTAISSTAGTRSATAGLVTSTVTTSRQIQFGMKFTF